MTSSRLPIFKADLTALHLEIEHHAQAAVETLAAGAALVEVKALVPHGGWADYLRETGILERTVARYMRLHRVGFKSATVADLGFAEVDGLITLSGKLWPRPQGGGHIDGGDATHDFMAVTLALDDAAAFYARVTGPRDHFRGGGHLFCCPKPLDRVWLAKVHFGKLGDMPITGSIAITAAQPEELLDTIQLEVVRHGWGTRLGIRGGA